MNKLKICVIPDGLLLGGGGAPDALHFHGLAVCLRDAGHEVELLDPRHGERGRAEARDLLRRYRDEGLRLVQPRLPAARASGSAHGRVAAVPYYAYEFLKQCGYDVIHATDRHGVAYYYLQALRLGILQRPARVWIHVGTPYLRALEQGAERMALYSDPLLCYLERRVVELADEVLVRSRTIGDWMKRAGYGRESGAFRLDPGMTLPLPPGLRRAAATERPAVQRLVFAGRLDPVGGLTGFCYMLRELQQRGAGPRSVLFIGEADPQFDAGAFIEEQAAGWNFPWQLRSDVERPELLAELAKPGTLTVFPGSYDGLPPALESCLALAVPFVATATGDLPRVLGEADAGLLTEPHHLALAERVEAMLREGAPVPATPRDPQANAATWLQWHAELPLRPDPAATPGVSLTRQGGGAAAAEGAPLVTVCVAHYNRPATLLHTLESLEAQTLRDFEVVVVDDGSEEEQRQQLEALVERFPHVRLVPQRNLYLGAARNTGARNARGKYLLFMDDDNCAKPEEIEALVGIAERNPVDILVTFSDNFTGAEAATPESLAGVRRLPLGQDLVYGLFRNGFGDSNCFMRREVWEALGGFTEHYRVGLDDHELFCRATLAGFRIDVVPEALYYYRVADQKMKRFHASRRADVQRVLQPYLDSGALPPHLLPMLYALRGFYERLDEAGLMRPASLGNVRTN